MADITYAQVSVLLQYEPETGNLFWKTRSREMFQTDNHWKAWNTRFAGKEAFTARNGDGYRKGKIFHRAYLAHRISWLLHHGSWPNGQIDHSNGDRTDNRIANLRDVSQAENHRNKRYRNSNASGVNGVVWNKQCQKWKSQVTIDCKNTYLGLFENFEDAVAARLAANAKYGFTDRHGRAALSKAGA